MPPEERGELNELLELSRMRLAQEELAAEERRRPNGEHAWPEIVTVEDASKVVSPFDDPENPREKIKITYRLEQVKSNGEPHEFSDKLSDKGTNAG